MNLLLKISCLIIMVATLSACNDSKRMAELEQYVAQLKKMLADKSKNQSKVEFKLPKPVTFGTPSTANNLMPDNAKTSPLQRYSLKALQFVGTITKHNDIHAYIMTPDSMIYEAKVGDVIGDSYGKISKIVTDHIEVMQGTGSASSQSNRVYSMPLKE